jgi:2-polyprenyl-3-methyl-5-hydroxy-6-metoxy-1,4-benzoquinol methylase
MLSQSGREWFESGLEIGCAEGAFTPLLAKRCRRLLAADISELALQRAAERCAEFGDVEFRKFDIREETRLGPFDLVVAMDVLPYFRRPQELRSAVRNIVQALSGDGQLLLSVTRPVPAVMEDTWWSRWMPRGKHILDFVARNPQLVELSRRTTATHYLALYQRSGHR